MRHGRGNSVIFDGMEIPRTAYDDAWQPKLTSKSGRPFYIAGIGENDATFRYMDDGEYITVPYEAAKKYL